MNNIVVHIANKDRPTECALLLQSLRTQTIQNFNIVILDDGSRTPLQNFYFIQYIVTRMQLEGHDIRILRNEIPSGVSKARQTLVDWSLKNGKEQLFVRLDDDVIVQPDYLEKLLKVIDSGYHIASGVTSPLAQPDWKRDVELVKPIIGYCELDKEGNIIYNGDDCGIAYSKDEIILSPHFRSCAMFKREVFESGVDYNSRLSKNGFREEQILSFKAIIKGFKIGIHTGANALHLLTPSGGERDTMDMTGFNEQIFRETVKRMFEDNGNFLHQYYIKHLGVYPGKTKMQFSNLLNCNGVKPYIEEEDLV